MMNTVNKWISGLVGLGALYLVVVNPNGFYKATQGIKGLVSGGVTQIVTGGKRG